MTWLVPAFLIWKTDTSVLNGRHSITSQLSIGRSITSKVQSVRVRLSSGVKLIQLLSQMQKLPNGIFHRNLQKSLKSESVFLVVKKSKWWIGKAPAIASSDVSSTAKKTFKKQIPITEIKMENPTSNIDSFINLSYREKMETTNFHCKPMTVTSSNRTTSLEKLRSTWRTFWLTVHLLSDHYNSMRLTTRMYWRTNISRNLISIAKTNLASGLIWRQRTRRRIIKLNAMEKFRFRSMFFPWTRPRRTQLARLDKILIIHQLSHHPKEDLSCLLTQSRCLISL